jgi:diadenosine tetraphosphate (Ap4A) HIT family hydrolase
MSHRFLRGGRRAHGQHMFVLDPGFEASSVFIAELKLCQARLQADARWPWIVLIPRAAAAREVEDLTPQERAQLMEEALAAGRAVRAVGAAAGRPVEKLNLGALGNVTPQLHVHIVGRRADDPSWPGPVWGVPGAKAYGASELAAALEIARRELIAAAG